MGDGSVCLAGDHTSGLSDRSTEAPVPQWNVRDSPQQHLQHKDRRVRLGEELIPKLMPLLDNNTKVIEKGCSSIKLTVQESGTSFSSVSVGIYFVTIHSSSW